MEKQLITLLFRKKFNSKELQSFHLMKTSCLQNPVVFSSSWSSRRHFSFLKIWHFSRIQTVMLLVFHFFSQNDKFSSKHLNVFTKPSSIFVSLLSITNSSCILPCIMSSFSSPQYPFSVTQRTKSHFFTAWCEPPRTYGSVNVLLTLFPAYIFFSFPRTFSNLNSMLLFRFRLYPHCPWEYKPRSRWSVSYFLSQLYVSHHWAQKVWSLVLHG